MRRNIWIVATLLALLPTIFIGCIANTYMDKSMAKLQNDSLQNMCDIVSNNIQLSYQDLLLRTMEAADEDVFLKLLSQSNVNGDTESDSLKQEARLLFYDKQSEIVGGSIVDRSGRVIVSTDPKQEGLQMNQTELYQRIMKGAPFYKTSIMDKQATHKLEIAVPITDSAGEVVGILRHVVNLQRLELYLDRVKIGKSGFAFLIRKDGPMIYSESKDYNEMIHSIYENSAELTDLLVNIENNGKIKKAGIIESQYNGKDMIGAYSVIPEAKCIIVATVDRDEIYAESEMLRSVIFAASLFIGTLAITAGYLFGRGLTDPLSCLNGMLKKIANGDLTLRCVYEGKRSEYSELCKSINQIADNLQKCETELRMSTRIDSLTRLPNRDTINEVLDTLLYKNEKQAILIFGLDDFKKFNDNLGYEIGDKLLCEVGDFLRTLPQHICYPSRLVSDEFLLFINDWDQESHPEKIAERIIRHIQSIHFVDDIRVSVSVSIGIEYLTEEKLDKTKLLKHGIIAMNKANDLGKNTYVVFSRIANEDS